jgi:FlaA1/EpsC-like NDP-sugar epimerase
MGVTLGVYTIIFFLFSLYDPDRTFRAIDEFYLISVVCFTAGLVLAGLLYFTELDITRLTLLYFYGFHFLFVVIWRIILRMIIRTNLANGQVVRRVLLIGSGEAAQHALMRLDELTWAGVELIGYLSEESRPTISYGEIPYMGNYKDINQVLSNKDVDDILVALPAESYNKAYQLVSSLFDKQCNHPSWAS